VCERAAVMHLSYTHTQTHSCKSLSHTHTHSCIPPTHTQTHAYISLLHTHKLKKGVWWCMVWCMVVYGVWCMVVYGVWRCVVYGGVWCIVYTIYRGVLFGIACRDTRHHTPLSVTPYTTLYHTILHSLSHAAINSLAPVNQGRDSRVTRYTPR